MEVKSMIQVPRNLVFLLLSTLVASPLLASATPTAPILERQELAIRNGNLSPVNVSLPLTQEKAIGWLYTAALGQPFCTATVVSENTILTARHCFYGEVNFPPSTTFEFHILSDQGRASQREDQRLSDAVFHSDESFSFGFNDVRASANYDIAIVQFPGSPFNLSLIHI